MAQQKILKKYNALCVVAGVRVEQFVNRYGTQMLLFTGASYLYFGLQDVAFAQSSSSSTSSSGGSGKGVQFDPAKINEAICQMLRLVEGSFGGLLMTVAGVGAVISAAFGQMKAGYSMLVTGLGAFILRSLVSLYFEIPADCGTKGALKL